ncbi:MAG: RHS repeat protein, partial [Ruminiclostridium sp.]|nr:RHS repeat protein [Ruminiclostridium sp.]
MDTSMLAMSMLGISYAYDKMNRRTQTKDINGQVLESIQYDANGNAVKIVDGLRYNGNMETSKGTSYVYDGLNRVIQATDAHENSRYYEYDILGNLTSQTDGRGNTTSWEYNPDGTLKKAVFADTGVVEYTYDLLGRKLNQKDQRGNVTSFAYNAFSKVRQEKDPYNNTVQYKYDLNGNVVSIRDKRGSVSVIKYDALNRPVEKRTPIELDGSGNFIYSIEKIVYDEAGNLKKRILSGTKDKFDSREMVYTYYANNLTDTITDSAGRYSKNHYDKNGNVIKVETLRETDIIDVERYEYDSMSRLTKQIHLVDEQDILNAGGMANLENLRDAEYPDKLQVITGFEYDLLCNK